jgi:glutamine synthetase
MPKPFSDDFRSGAHFNMSLADAKSGANLFRARGGARHARGRYGVNCSDPGAPFHRGLKRHAAAITAVTCPSYNSYQGLIAQGELREFSWAPVLIAWGKNKPQRDAATAWQSLLRRKSRRGQSTNPYLSAAISLAAGLEGIEQELDPGEPVERRSLQARTKEIAAAGCRFCRKPCCTRSRHSTSIRFRAPPSETFTRQFTRLTSSASGATASTKSRTNSGAST